MSLVHRVLPPGVRSRAPSAGTSTPVAALQVIPCLRVASIAVSVSFYTIVLGFVPYGRQGPDQASLFRGPPGRPSSLSLATPGVHVQLRVPVAHTHIHPQMLWLLVSDVDAFFDDAARKLEVAVAPSHGYFPAHTFGEARIVTRPQTMPWGTRECRIIDPDGHTWVITQVQR